MLPLQILFSVVFFVSVGMLLDLGFLLSSLPLVLVGRGGVLVIKVLMTGASARALGYSFSDLRRRRVDAGPDRRVLLRARTGGP